MIHAREFLRIIILLTIFSWYAGKYMLYDNTDLVLPDCQVFVGHNKGNSQKADAISVGKTYMCVCVFVLLWSIKKYICCRRLCSEH